MGKVFSNQGLGRTVLKHKDLPIYITEEKNFYRCICFNNSFYGKTVSELHKGNLRNATPKNRYSMLFPNEKISYWADSPKTARAEVKYHNHTSNLLTFWAYDDATSTFPIIDNDEPLIIIDGSETNFHHILEKIEKGKSLTYDEEKEVERIKKENPDCLAYCSLRNEHGINYLFFEKGFKKLAIREVRLRLGDIRGKNSNRIVCASSSDYSPCLEGYGKFFSPLAGVNMMKEYKESQEYKKRTKVHERSLERYFCTKHGLRFQS